MTQRIRGRILIRGRRRADAQCGNSVFSPRNNEFAHPRRARTRARSGAHGVRRSRLHEPAYALTKMSGQDAKNKETESKIMGAAEAVTALIDAVTKENADGVRAAAERFKKDTKSDINSLGDANGRTPMHLVRAHIFPQTRRSSRPRSRSVPRALRGRPPPPLVRAKKTLAFLRPPNANVAKTTIDSERRLVAVAVLTDTRASHE